jgi:hypothetical protein
MEHRDIGHAQFSAQTIHQTRAANNPKGSGQCALFERRHKIIAGLHTGGRTSDALGLKGGLNERGIVWIILQVQDVERGFHF